MRTLLALALGCIAAYAPAQWDLQTSHTTANLRGIHALEGGIAWASGSEGTVLRTLDSGKTWTRCAIPPDAAGLDLRGVQALDADTALAMSIGTGELSRIFKTADGCKTWREVFRNPDAKGFFDSIQLVTAKQVFVLGDPVDGKFAMFTSRDAGDTWFLADDPGLDAPAGSGAFAASNSALTHMGPFLLFGSGGTRAAVYGVGNHCDAKTGQCGMSWTARETPLAHGSAPTGIFSLAGRFSTGLTGKMEQHMVAVGGAYDKPADTTGTAAFSLNGGITWLPAETPPHGYRSAVAFNSATATWIAVGPNGTDLSTDDGRTWHAPSNVVLNVDHEWNALSLPFVVGSRGRIAILQTGGQ